MYCSSLQGHVQVSLLVSILVLSNVLVTLWQCGVDANATDRVLLQSCTPSLHTNADCTALVAAVVSRQISVVRLLLKVKKLMLDTEFGYFYEFCFSLHLFKQHWTVLYEIA